MRISDWSSDVCSSDLPGGIRAEPAQHESRQGLEVAGIRHAVERERPFDLVHRHAAVEQPGAVVAPHRVRIVLAVALRQIAGDRRRGRSEEHTSELQSLMRISYAVFCLKKKNEAATRLRPMSAHTTT